MGAIAVVNLSGVLMAEINYEILQSAVKLGFLPKVLSRDEMNVLNRSVITANELIRAIQNAKEQGLDLEQLTDRMDINSNTILIYCRFLKAAKLIEVGGGLGKEPAIYYPIQSDT